MTETIEQKAQRILTEGRLTVVSVLPTGLIVASCRGTDTIHALGYDPKAREFRCTCEASAKFRRRCSHILALTRVVVRPPAPSTEGETA